MKFGHEFRIVCKAGVANMAARTQERNLTAIPPAGAACPGPWSFLERVYDQNGLSAIAWLLLGYAFYQLIWKVWSAALKGKDDEIRRLIQGRKSSSRRSKAGAI